MIEEVQSTKTHIVLKQYKDHGTMFVGKADDKRRIGYSSNLENMLNNKIKDLKPSEEFVVFFDMAVNIKMTLGLES